MEMIVVGITEGKTAARGQALVSYALGSCVGVCLYESRLKIAGMAHVILPDQNCSRNRENEYKFAGEGTRRLIQEMYRLGGEKRYMTAKIAGGARMFRFAEMGWDIGKNNVERVKRVLEEEGIRLVGEDTGKDYGRTITFFAENGVLEVNTVRHAPLRL